MDPFTSLLGDDEDAIVLGDQESEYVLWGISPDGGDMVAPDTEEFPLDGFTPALGDVNLFPSSDDSASSLFSSVPQLDQTGGSDFAFLPSLGADSNSFLPSSSPGNNDVFAFNFKLDDTNRPEGFIFALTPETDGPRDGGFYSSRS